MDFNELARMQSLIVLDVETTGLSTAREDRVCEIGAVKIKNGDIVDTFHSLINPSRPISYGAYIVHRISDEMVEGAPTFREVSHLFEHFLSDAHVAAYNAWFDVNFLNNEFAVADAHCSITRERVLDILPLSRRFLPGFGSYSLSNVARILEIDNGVAHRALDDAVTAWEVLKRIFGIMKRELPARKAACRKTSKRYSPKNNNNAILTRKKII